MEIVGSMQTGLSVWWLAIAILMVLLIADIVRNDVKVLPKWAWVGVAVFLFPIGPILYILWGRASRRRPLDGQSETQS